MLKTSLQFISHPFISDPTFLFNSNGDMIPLSLSLKLPLFSPYCSYNCHSQKTRIQKTILCSRNKRRRYGFERSTKLVLESACIIASKIGILPEPLELLLREFGGGSSGGSNGGGFGSWNGFGWGAFDGSKKRRKSKLGILVILVILGVGLWLVLGKELVIDDVFLGGLGLVLFGFSMDGWKRGAKDWVLGFCCCAVLMGFLCKKENIEGCVRYFRTMKLNRRRKWRVF